MEPRTEIVAKPTATDADGYGSYTPAAAALCSARCFSTSALIRLYSSWNSRPSRFSHSISDGVKGRGTKEVSCLGFGEEVEPEADGFLPVLFEGFAMFVPQILEGFRPQRKDFAPAAGAQRRRQDDVAARRLDVASQVRQRSAEADVIVHQNVEITRCDGSGECRLEREPVEARRARVADRVGLDYFARHGEAEALPKLVRHGVGDEIDAGSFDGADGNEDRPSSVPSQNLLDPNHRGVRQEGAGEPSGSMAYSCLPCGEVGVSVPSSHRRVDHHVRKVRRPGSPLNRHAGHPSGFEARCP